MTDPTPTPTPQAPSQGLTDAQLLELAAREIEPYDRIPPGEYEAEYQRALEVYGSELIAAMRAAIAADRAARVGLAPPQGLTDAQLLELMPQQFQDDLATVSRLAAYGTPTEPGLYRVSLNTGAVAYARAAIAADRAARPTPTPEALQAAYVAWFKAEQGIAPLSQAARTAAAFASAVLRGEVAA